MEIEDLISIILGVGLTITSALLSIIWKGFKADITDIKNRLTINENKGETRCRENRKDIYEKYLPKELYMSEKQPLVDKLGEIEQDMKESIGGMQKKIDDMNIGILTIKNSVHDLQKSTIMQEASSKDIMTLLTRIAEK